MLVVVIMVIRLVMIMLLSKWIYHRAASVVVKVQVQPDSLRNIQKEAEITALLGGFSLSTKGPLLVAVSIGQRNLKRSYM